MEFAITLTLVQQACEGNKVALEQLIMQSQGPIYNLALRMLTVPADVEDATQEILLKILTHLSEFRGESAFTTWVYRIATNHLLNTARHATRHQTFERLGGRIDLSLAFHSPDVAVEVEQRLLEEEVMRSCTLGMLRCLDRDQRIVVILADIFEITSDQGAQILDITPASFRKRLSRARMALVAFVARRCGIVDPANPCRCSKHVNNKIHVGLLDPAHLRYATADDAASRHQYEVAQSQELSALARTAGLLRAHPTYAPSGTLLQTLRAWIDNPQSYLLENAPVPAPLASPADHA